MQEFVETLETEFQKFANPQNAAGQKAYMKNHFEFLGISSPIRREIQKPFLQKQYLPPKSQVESIVKTFWAKPEREYHYFAQEFCYKYLKQFEKADIELFEYMVIHNSWWDTIDFISPKLMAEYFKLYPEQITPHVNKWLASGNIWLQRSSILFQLHYKENLDTALLASSINYLLGSKEFFINKAIGWMLRQYSRTNPDWVRDFANNTNLANLSRKEALRLIKD